MKWKKRFVVRGSARFCSGSALGWPGSEFGRGSASLGSRSDSRSVRDSYSGRLGSKVSSARLSSCLRSVPDSTWLKTPLSARLGSAQIGLNSVPFGSVLEVLLRDRLSFVWKPDWLEALLTSVLDLT